MSANFSPGSSSSTSEAGDAALLMEIARHRDDVAFTNLYSRHAEAAFALALSLTHDRALAEDAFQESMLRIWRSADSFRPGNVRGWVLRIVGRECMRLQKARQQEKKRVKNANALREQDSNFHDGPEREHRFLALRNALAMLPSTELSLLKLCYEEGLSQRRISAAIAIPQQTISYRVRRAVSRLSRELASAEPCGSVTASVV